MSQAVDRYLREPPPLPRLRTQTKPPEGYVRLGPKDAPEAIAEYLLEDQAPPIQVRRDPSPGPNQPKARLNQEALDNAVYLYSEDPKERRILKGHGEVEGDSSAAPSSSGDAAPPMEPEWHSSARMSA